MDRISDIWKKFPLLVLGEAPTSIPSSSQVSMEELLLLPNLNNFYIVIALPTEQIALALATLEEAKVQPDQVLVFLPAEHAFSHAWQGALGLLDIMEGEGAEEFRARLLGRLECQRQKKLSVAFQEAFQNGLARKLSESDLAFALDAARIAHSIASGLATTPEIHTRALQACFQLPTTPAVWGAHTTVDRLIPEAGFFIAECAAKGLNVRDALKEKAAALPFRLRTDLIHQVENCLGLLIGGKSRAA